MKRGLTDTTDDDTYRDSRANQRLSYHGNYNRVFTQPKTKMNTLFALGWLAAVSVTALLLAREEKE
jgi:hypothetical protein